MHPVLPARRPNAFRLLLEAETMRLGCVLRIAMEVDGLNAILSLVREGFGHAVLPAEVSRRVYLGRWMEVPVYDLAGLPPGHEVKGAAILESPTTTVLIRAGERSVVTPEGWLDIRLA